MERNYRSIYLVLAAIPLALVILNLQMYRHASILSEAVHQANARSESLEIGLRIQNHLDERANDLKVLSEVWAAHRDDQKFEHFYSIANSFVSDHPSYHAINYVDEDSIVRATVPKSNEPALLGRDLKELPGRIEMHERVRSSGQPLLSPPIVLVGKYPGFVLWRPVNSAEHNSFHGFVAAAIKIEDLAEEVLREAHADSFALRVKLGDQVIYSEDEIPDDQSASPVGVERFQAYGQTWSVEAFPRQGTPLSELGRPVQWSLYFGIGLSILTGILLLLVAFSNKRLFSAQREIKASEEDLRITMASIGDAVISTDIEGRILRMNPVAEALTGWNFADARGRPLSDIFRIVHAVTREPAANPVERVIESGEIVGLANHTVLISKDGREYQIADSGAPIKDDSGSTRGVVLVFRDVTEEYALQEELRQSQKLQAIGQLAGGVAHDFNNMLGGIMGSAELLQKLRFPEPKAEKYISMIVESAERAAQLTEKLLAFARKEIKHASTFDVNLVIMDALDLLKSTSDPRIEFNINLAADHTRVDGDLSQLQNAFLNVALNAVQAMPDGGRLDVSSKAIVLDQHYCKASPFDLTPSSYVEIEFRDTGYGIDPKDMQRIFDPFFTTKKDNAGTGLGLSAVYGTIQAHKGAVSVYSELGTGTSFHILIPLSEKEASVTPGGGPRPVSGAGRILLVDDEEVMRVTGQAILEDLGYKVTVAANGKHALEIFGKDPEAFDLVILDMIMPEMNGRDCFAALRALRNDMRVILSSGFTRENELDEMMEKGLKGFIRKPFRMAELSRLMHEVLAS